MAPLLKIQFSKKSPFEQFKKAVAKNDVSKAKKAMKSVSFDACAPLKCSKWELKWSEYKDDLRPIHYICCKGDRKMLNMFLDEHESECHEITVSGLTTVHFAVYYSKYDILEELLSRGVDVDAKDTSKGYTALHLAVEKRNMGAVKRLVEDGLADINLQDKTGTTPTNLATKAHSKTIIKFFQTSENKLKYERDMQRMASEQTRQANEQTEMIKRNSALEETITARLDEFKVDFKNEMRAEYNAEARRRASDECSNGNLDSFTSVRPKSTPRLQPPPPVQPRSRVDSFESGTAPSFSAAHTSSPLPSRGVSQTVRNKVEWWNKKHTSKNSLNHDESHELIARRRLSSCASQLHLNQNDSRQRLVSSPYGSHVELAAFGGLTECDLTSGFGSHANICEEEDVLSPLARQRIQANLPDLIYYLRYKRLHATLFSKGVLHPFDVEKLESMSVNHEQITYILNNIILKGTNATLRLFLECLEENNYSVHAKKILHVDALSWYTDKSTQQFANDQQSRIRHKSMPSCYHGEFKMAVEATDLTAGDEC